MTDEQKNLIRKLYNEKDFGMLDCKNALIKNDWDIQEAKEYLEEREKFTNLISLVTRRSK